MLKPEGTGLGEGTDIPLQELVLENISYDWIAKCVKPSYLRRALKLIDDDGRLCSLRQLFPRPSSCRGEAPH